MVQGTLMRITIHLVSAASYWRYAEGLRDARRRTWQPDRRVRHVELQLRPRWEPDSRHLRRPHLDL